MMSFPPSAICPGLKPPQMRAPDMVGDGVELIPLPGHTHGHCGFLIGTREDGLLLWGDVMHLPELQASDPEVSIIYDLYPEQAAETRITALRDCLEAGFIIGGGHLGRFMCAEWNDSACRLVPIL
ncbi:MBL fold metallo-hydrolase [uncultured Cohaesibacter sp.]|uniref:MBL fold metallo-hydrolase n=1 Tax=uncultured Cohaesibacter sp. TaxID=1002546 RepID=UPI0029C8A585|nr:MBL fold metallo-hydrolase [uncultured Cohaesibacter sp.]